MTPKQGYDVVAGSRLLAERIGQLAFRDGDAFIAPNGARMKPAPAEPPAWAIYVRP